VDDDLEELHRLVEAAQLVVLDHVLRTPTASDGRIARACAALAAARAEEAVPLLRRLCRPEFKESTRLAAVRALVAITGEARGFAPAQTAREREEAYAAWSE
jgi:hypothetical protein